MAPRKCCYVKSECNTAFSIDRQSDQCEGSAGLAQRSESLPGFNPSDGPLGRYAETVFVPIMVSGRGGPLAMKKNRSVRKKRKAHPVRRQ